MSGSMLLPVTLAEGPWIEVTSPEDGGWVTSSDLEVTGNATPIYSSMVLEGESMPNGTGYGLSWDGANLTLRPEELFLEEFSGTELDTDTWTVVRDQGDIVVENGWLTLTKPLTINEFPLVRSKGDLFTDDIDWTARFAMTLSGWGYSGSGGGIGTLGADQLSSHMSAYNLFKAYPNPIFNVYADGHPVFNSTTTGTSNVIYSLSFDNSKDLYTVWMGDAELGSFEKDFVPDGFWFGSTVLGLYFYYSTVEVDFADIWSFSGKWTFDPFELDHPAIIDTASLGMTSSHMSKASVVTDLKYSMDNVTWSDWIALVDGAPVETVEAQYLQFKVEMSLPDVWSTDASIKVDQIRLGLHHPLTRVEVRNADGNWTDATGLETWRATVPLHEDDNTIEVRVTDTKGDTNVTSFTHILDTTAPVGTLEILQDRPFTNDLNVTLHLNATDTYGVKFVHVSNDYDFRDKVVYPYTEALDWKMKGIEGEIFVYVRYVDSHGLTSAPSSDSILYDSFPPSGRVVIEDDRVYTPTLRVGLDLEYSDTRGISLIELSNHANFTDVHTIIVGLTDVANWSLLDGGDGPRTVYMRLTDVAGNTRLAQDTIEYYAPKAIGSFTIEDGANITKDIIVDIDVNISIEYNTRLMQFSNEPAFLNATWETVSKTTRWYLSQDDGPKVVYLRFLDFRDIISLPVNSTIFLDTTPPEVTLVINGGAMYTTRTSAPPRGCG